MVNKGGPINLIFMFIGCGEKGESRENVQVEHIKQSLHRKWGWSHLGRCGVIAESAQQVKICVCVCNFQIEISDSSGE